MTKVLGVIRRAWYTLAFLILLGLILGLILGDWTTCEYTNIKITNFDPDDYLAGKYNGYTTVCKKDTSSLSILYGWLIFTLPVFASIHLIARWVFFGKK